jgi:hypothetical protein
MLSTQYTQVPLDFVMIYFLTVTDKADHLKADLYTYL